MYSNTVFLVTVNPKMYCGTPHHFAFRNKDNAKKKFDELVKKYHLYHDGSYRVAWEDSESLQGLYFISTVELNEISYDD